MRFEPNAMATAIGSLPHKNAEEASLLMLEALPEAPAWPQLPARSFKENMYVQYSKNMPGVLLDEEKEKIIIDPTDTAGLEKFYERYLAKDTQYFALGEEYAKGFYYFTDLIAKSDTKPKVIKGQVTGPISYGLTVKQSDERSIIFDKNFFDAIVKTLALKAKYQVDIFKKISPESIPLIFLDEPYLVSFGSAFVSVNEDEVIEKLNECFDAIDGLKGIHVCGGTDWGMIMKTNVDVIHFDAFDYFESMKAYAPQLKEFIDRGGMIGWGAVPHDDKIRDFTAERLFALLDEKLDRLSELGLDKKSIYKASWIAPSCGVGLMTTDDAQNALKLSTRLAELIREQI